MKTKIKKCSKSLITMLLSLLMILSAFPLTSFASTYITDMNSNAQFGVVSGSYEKYGHEMHYAKYDGKTYIVFCCQFGVTSPDGSTYKYGSDFRTYVNNKGDTYDTIATYIAFGYTLQYGDGLPDTKAEWIAACCTQQYVWEKLGVNPTRSSWDSTYMSNSLYNEWKANTEKLIDLYYNKKPSFNGTAKNINLGGSTTLTDSNGVLKYYPTFSKTINNVTFKHTKGENTLSISVAENCSTHSVTFNSASQKVYQGLPTGQNFDADTMNYVYFNFDSGSVQDLMFSNYVDPQNFKVDVKVEFGNLKISKTSEDEIIKNIPFTIKGNGKTYNVTTDANGNAELKNIPVGTYEVYEGDILRYVKQATKTVTVTDGNTANVTFKNELKKGNIKIQKNAEDKIVKDFTFSVKGSDGSSYTATTNASGIATITGVPIYDKNNNVIVYTVKEESVPIRYVTPSNQTLTVEANKTSSVTFNNDLEKGDILIQKNSEDKIVKGFTFSVKGSDGSSYTATTNDEGIAIVKDVPVYDSNNKKILYSVEETNVAVRYVTPDGQTVTLEPNKTSSLTFNNILKKFRVNVVKFDIEKGKAQGDAKLSNAKYGMFKGEQLIDVYYTDKNASFTTKYYVCGTDWTIRELEASEGYLVNSKIEKVGADPALYTVEYNTTANNVVEMPIKNKISLIKHSDDGSSKIETPEANAEFQVYLKSSGSYNNADPDERDIIVTNEYGFGTTKLLPYGTYTVHQTKGTEGTEYIADFDVFIDKNDKEYKYLINDPYFYSYVKIVKPDAETGKQIAYAGAGFQLYAPNGEKVSMTYTYPTPTTIDTFYTNSEGYLVTPEKLQYGKGYKLVEVSAPYGYVLDKTPIEFDITQEHSTIENALTIVRVSRPNFAQKGIIEITKTGEVFSSVSENNDIYTPIYKNGNLANAVFQIFAAEDITTLDGTVRAEKGELVDEITTGKDGIAKSKELYLGKYTVIEKTAPTTFYNANKQYNLELTYAGQNVKVTSTALSVNNERQKVTVSLAKIIEQDELFNLGMNKEILSVQFGIYADENIKAADGKAIPKNALITYGYCNENGKLAFNCDLPIGYKFYAKEMSTDSHYILSNARYTFNTEYKGQNVNTIKIDLNSGQKIKNNLIYGTIKGLKIDREAKETIEGALFGLFKSNETDFTKSNAILTVETDENGIFIFDNIPFDDWVVKELQPANNYLPTDDIHHITVSENEQIIEITAINDRIPELKTTATINEEKEVFADEIFTLVDSVEYQHLIPNKEYVLKGTLMDKSTGKELVINGETITVETTFIPTEPSGIATVEFTFDSKYITEDTDIVVFESLYKDKKELAVHADIDDEGQSVKIRVPEIKTTATVNGEKDIYATDVFTLTDTVEYKSLIPNKEYTLIGVLMDKTTGKELVINDETITAETTFIPTEPNGTATVEFTFNAKYITESTDIVVFESLYNNGKELTVHADIEDIGQTIKVYVPEIKTTATVEEEKEICATEVYTLTDTVEYTSLIPNKEYTLTGVLMDKNTGKELVINGETITAETTFIPTEPNGTVTVEFTFDSKYIKADTELVAFETLYHDGKELVVHTDLEDKGQTVTVKVPEIQTTATIDSEKEITVKDKITIDDIVEYRNLTVGKEYKIVGTLMDKSTGKPFEINGKPVISEVVFTPEKSNGKVTVSFTFDGKYIKETTELVVFETLYRDNVEIAVHADIKDDGQTVKINVPVPEKPSTPKTGDDSNTALWVLLGSFSALGIVVLSAYLIRKRQTKKED